MPNKLKSYENRFGLYDITIIALFAALCYISLVIFFVPVGPMFVHIGNLLVVTAALLCGGLQGGIAGSVGMGLFDLLNGHADSAPKTIVLKFLIGLTVGLVYISLEKRKRYPKTMLLVCGAVSLLVAVSMLIYTINANSGFTFKTGVLIPIFTLVGTACIVFAFLQKFFSQTVANAVVAATCGMAVNIMGETLYKFVYQLLVGADFSAAVSFAILAQASTLINAGLAIVGGVALFIPLKHPFNKIRMHRVMK